MHLTACIAAWIVTAALTQVPASQSGEPADSAELSRLEQVWNEAHMRGDAEALDRLWADDLLVTVPNMSPMSKAETIGIWQSGRMRFSRYETSDIRIRVYNDAAVVTGRVRRTRSINGRDVDDDWRFTKMYIRRGGTWQVVAWHASTAAPPSG